MSGTQETPSGAQGGAHDGAHAAHSAGKPHACCAICGKHGGSTSLVRLDVVRPSLAERIRAKHPELAPDALICREDVAVARSEYLSEMLTSERGELTGLEHDVIESLAADEIISANAEAEFAEKRTFGQQCADGIASFGGSWTFIISFLLVLTVWIIFNGLAYGALLFDPYPFILLNLALSCVAALQAPIIMMSQKRQEVKDRLRSENDYRINLKAELEIRNLHEKVDHLLVRQWERLAEIQAIQIELMEDMAKRRGG